jgi:hypothetical protein
MSNYKLAKKRFGFKNDVFPLLAPADKKIIKETITGRSNELEILKSKLNTPNPSGVFLVGIFGTGKTILVRELHRQLLLNKRVLCGYYEFDPQKTFEEYLVQYFNSHELFRGYNIKNVSELVQLCVANKKKPILIMDNFTEWTEMETIVATRRRARELMSIGLNVLLVGHPVGVTASFGSMSDTFERLELTPLSPEDLVSMTERYLVVAKNKTSVSNTEPFDIDAIKFIAKLITDNHLTPRQHMFVCRSLLHDALLQGGTAIDVSFVTTRWPNIAQNIVTSVLEKPEHRQYFNQIYNSGKIAEDESSDELLNMYMKHQGSNIADYRELRDLIKDMFDKDLLHQTVDKGGVYYQVNPLLSPIYDSSKEEINSVIASSLSREDRQCLCDILIGLDTFVNHPKSFLKLLGLPQTYINNLSLPIIDPLALADQALSKIEIYGFLPNESITAFHSLIQYLLRMELGIDKKPFLQKLLTK